ncbi:L-ribulokinase [Fontibacillus phaseoli]|uniref:Ribulokinase n=1 Tax=Fontibacillus phaseoli TaxID=1416533 RepID=A0A369BSI4_9BACL|nr:ribulokinase [Fontibacillus phaseoli]RCX23556.1 L-ribulokinase [Fontibacillus phaseoli]
MNKKYAIGMDFGTESGRAVLVDLSDGTEITEHVTPYSHGVITEYLPNSDEKLGQEWALQHPGDYLEVLERSIPAIMKASGIEPNHIIGIGVDFTSCTMLPVDTEGSPLCFKPEWKGNPHSWVKLWKHHAAQHEANEINRFASERGEAFLSRYGGKISSEWMIAKILQILSEAPEVYEETDRFVEAADWVVGQLTGVIVRNSCSAGYKAMWNKQKGYPEEAFFQALHPRMGNLVHTKLRGEVIPLGAKVGELTEEMATRLELKAGITIATGCIDAHAAVPAVGVVTPGELVMTMGTSTCHLLLSAEDKPVKGICGVVEDGIIPGLFAYEAGQPAVGDLFAWYVNQAVPEYVKHAAEQEGISVHGWLEQRAAVYWPGQTGLLALDWWNGNRSVLGDANLSGLILGLTLQTKPEEIYRALLESTAFGTRKIVEEFQTSGVEIVKLYACGGLPQKNALLMQIYADVTNLEIIVADSKQTSALGAAIFAAVAAGSAQGGYDSIVDAAQAMARVKEESYKPIPSNVIAYDKLYKEYSQLYDYFGSGANDVMKRLKALAAY